MSKPLGAAATAVAVAHKHQVIFPKFVFLGDSITQFGYNTNLKGWVASISNDWMRKVSTLNYGFSGYNSRWCKELFTPILDNLHAPAEGEILLSIIFLGSNDCVDDITSQQGVPLEEYKKNLHSLIQQAQAASSQRVLLITPPPVDEVKWQTRPYQRVQQYRKACLEVGKSNNVPVLDTWIGFLTPDHVEGQDEEEADLSINQTLLDFLLIDGLHLSAEGNNLLYTLLKRKIIQSWPELEPENALGFITPPWRDIQSNDIHRFLFPKKK